MSEKQTKGFFWHVHHDALLEWSDNSNERIEYIKANKPKREQKLRLRLLKPVKGELPEAVLKAWAAYVKARAAYVKAGAAYDKALRDNANAINKLHAKECSGCPWDGKTIFPPAPRRRKER